MKRALILGIDGTIGSALAKRLIHLGWAVTGTSRRPNSDALFLDLASDDIASAEFPTVDVAFFCAAMSRFSECREHPELTHRVNVSAPLTLATKLSDVGSHVVLLSTSAVFDGAQPFSSITRPVCPSSVYGVQKAEAEDGFLALREQATVLRLTKVIHPDWPLFRNWIEHLRRGEPVRAFSDLSIAPLLLEHVTGALVATALDASGGIFHVSGARDISYLEAARWMANQLGADPALVKEGTTAEARIPANDVLTYTSLDCSRLSALTGSQPLQPEEVISKALDIETMDS